MQPKISVIVPVYKVERYLEECIDSIIAQTYKNLEIILVNDGSPDNCGKLCDDYADKDKRIVVMHKKNGGLSDARNVGIDNATGEYLHFIDGDDWIEADMLEVLYENIIKYDSDISCCSFCLVYINSIESYNSESEIFIFNSEQAIENCFVKNIPWISSCCKLYKKYIFDNIRFPLNKRSEDIFIITDVMSAANKIVYDSVSKYYYRQRKNSISRYETYNPNIMDFIEAYEYNLKIIEIKYPNLINCTKNKILSANLWVLYVIILNKNYKKIPDFKKTLLVLRKNYKNFMCNNFFTLNEKIKVVAIKTNINLYKLLQFINDKKKKRIIGKKYLFE